MSTQAFEFEIWKLIVLVDTQALLDSFMGNSPTCQLANWPSRRQC